MPGWGELDDVEGLHAAVATCMPRQSRQSRPPIPGKRKRQIPGDIERSQVKGRGENKKRWLKRDAIPHPSSSLTLFASKQDGHPLPINFCMLL